MIFERYNGGVLLMVEEGRMRGYGGDCGIDLSKVNIR